MFTTEDLSVSLLQFFLSLYGHKLPVLCLDISHVSTAELQMSSLSVTGHVSRVILI